MLGETNPLDTTNP